GGRGRKGAVVILPLLAALFVATRSTLRDAFVKPDGEPELPEEPEAWVDQAPHLLDLGVQMVPGAFFALVIAAALATAYGLLPSRFPVPKGILAALLALVVFVDLNGAGVAELEARSEENATLKIVERDLAEYYEPTGATRFLQSADDPPYRYFGYAPSFGPRYNPFPLNVQFTDPEVRKIEASNRATMHGGDLQSAQGYNAVHLARYDEYLEAMNARSQNYHDADVFAVGLRSPLLDLLNARYILTPASISSESPLSSRLLDRNLPSVYVGAAEDIKVLENPDALPRAWIVHSAREVGPRETRELFSARRTGAREILDLLSSGEVDPRETALLESPPPTLEEPEEPSTASVTEYEANSIEVETSTDADGLLVLSEVYYPAWKAYVDGEPVEIERANYLFRSIPVPAGEHVVELRYESWTLRAGFWISFLTTLVLAGLLAVRLAFRSRRSPGVGSRGCSRLASFIFSSPRPTNFPWTRLEAPRPFVFPDSRSERRSVEHIGDGV
ncbi:MAG: YfhO family protein, partial [Rubrobacteraceae bacterium]